MIAQGGLVGSFRRRGADDFQTRAGFQCYNAASFACLGDNLAHARNKAFASGGSQQHPAIGNGRENGDNIVTSLDIDHRAHRLTKTARAGELVGTQGVKTAICCGNQYLVGGLGMEGESGAIPFFKLEVRARRKVSMTLHRLDPAALRHNNGHGFALYKGLKRNFARLPCFFQACPAASKRRFFSVILTQCRQVFLQTLLLERRAFDQFYEIFPLGL